MAAPLAGWGYICARLGPDRGERMRKDAGAGGTRSADVDDLFAWVDKDPREVALDGDQVAGVVGEHRILQPSLQQATVAA